MVTSTNSNAYWAVIPAAGKGSRMASETPKQYLPLAGKAVIEHTIQVFIEHPKISGVVVVIASDDSMWPEIRMTFEAQTMIAIGGAERCHSVLSGLDVLQPRVTPQDWVLVHDAARPCLRAADIDRMIDELSGHSCGGILAAPVRDTLKRCSVDGEVEQTVDRTRLWHALTPQMFRFEVLRNAIEIALNNELIVTDEAQAIEAAGGSVRIVEGHVDNIKITHPADLALAEMYLEIQGRG